MQVLLLIVPRLDAPKVIGDPVHGQIHISNLEYDILQLPTLNRLHQVKQTATAYLTFPGSVTTRFSHIVGALHVGDLTIRRLLQNSPKTYFDELFKDLSIDFIIKTVRLACLFHDVGHGPFSHSAERAMVRVMKKYHVQEIPEVKRLFPLGEDETEEDLPIHEFFSYKLVTNGEIKTTIKNCIEGGTEMVKSVSALLVKSHIGYAKEYSDGYSILRKIISSQIDADRMDYLLRDSLMSGVQFGQTDIFRIINNMAIKKRPKLGKYEIAIHARALGNIEDMLDARFKMYKWFYQHHAVTNTNALIKRAIEKIILERKSIANLFHWSSYASGESTDENILSIILELIKKKKNTYARFIGLFDRRYLPVSVFKHTLDYVSMIGKIKETTELQEDDKAIHNKIQSFFTQKSQPGLKTMLEKRGTLKDAYVFSENFPRTPYQPLSGKNTILIYGTSKDEGLRELTTLSPYSVKINEEWKDFPSLRVYYLIPDKTKIFSQKYVKDVRNVIAESIARS